MIVLHFNHSPFSEKLGAIVPKLHMGFQVNVLSINLPNLTALILWNIICTAFGLPCHRVANHCLGHYHGDANRRILIYEVFSAILRFCNSDYGVKLLVPPDPKIRQFIWKFLGIIIEYIFTQYLQPPNYQLYSYFLVLEMFACLFWAVRGGGPELAGG